MEATKNNRFVITLVSMAGLGLALVSVLLGWEFWMPPLFILGAAALWIMHIAEKPDTATREICCFIYTLVLVLFHGVHETSFQDIAIVMIIAFIIFTLMGRMYMLNILLVEYLILGVIQLFLASVAGTLSWDTLAVSRLILHLLSVCCAYMACSRLIMGKVEEREISKEKDDRIEAYDADMEDFLTNISHELRTPVNVVNGMSDLLIKKNAGDEIFSIRDAGIRLSYQIEDIQDFTETKRNNVILEQEDYMSTSLINDVVTSFRRHEEEADLELIVDMDPNVPSVMYGDIKKLHKIFRHLLENAIKFTKTGGIYINMHTEETSNGINLCIEVTDTGIGMSLEDMEKISDGMYQANKTRTRSSGGIGLGLSIVYGLAHSMEGFVKIESEKGIGTTVRVTIPQKIIDGRRCLELSDSFTGVVLFHVRSDKYSVPRVRDFYRSVAVNIATNIGVPLYPAETVKEIDNLREKQDVRYIFMGEEEYGENSEYFDELSKGDITVVVSARQGFKPNSGSAVMVMPKPLYAYPVVKILNEGKDAENIELAGSLFKPSFDGVNALIVDDEPMNLVVASGLFRDYGMVIETASSGREAIEKYKNGDYDIIFMDHMMPEMDGVETMKRIRAEAAGRSEDIAIVALTANAVSGAKEMFLEEGFDGFIAKPINIADFERVVNRVLTEKKHLKMGGRL